MTPEEEPSSAGPDTALDSTDAPSQADVAPPSAAAPPSPMVVIGRLTGRSMANWRPILLIALVVAAIGLAAGLLLVQYRPDRRIDDAAAGQAIRAASDGAVASLSYSSDNLEHDFANAKSHLTGDFLAYYTKFTGQIVAPLVQQKHLTQKAVVVRAAVSELHPNSAVVLVFLNESTTSVDKPQPLITPSSVRITLTKVKGSWLISKLDPTG